MKSAALASLFLLALGTAPGVADPCAAPETWHALSAADKTPFKAALSVGAATPKVGAPFEVQLKVCNLDNAPIDRLEIDANMPAHKHGMNYAPKLSKTGDGHYKATGFLFHMPGVWQITVSVYSAGQPNHLSVDIDVP